MSTGVTARLVLVWALWILVPPLPAPPACAAQKLPVVEFVTEEIHGSPGELRIRIGGKAFATYVYGDPKIPRPYFAHVCAPSGIQVTRQHPPPATEDHPLYHPGLWLTFADINGNDYWRLKARVVHDGFVEHARGAAGRGSFAVRNRYLSARTAETVCVETCRLTILVRPPGYLILWESEFGSDSHAVTFGDQEEFGLGVRVRTSSTVDSGSGGRILDSAGRINGKAIWGQQADWCDYSGIVGDQRVGITVMPDPKNFRRSWFHARDYGLLLANPFGRAAFGKGARSAVVVTRGETLHLGFGVFVYSVPSSSEAPIESVYRDYVARAPAAKRGTPWARHTIDDSSRGADGVRLADVNGDGLLDIATGWEEGGTVRIYLNPGPSGARKPWPRATVGTVGSPEDAVFTDLDRDGNIDVVSSCEGKVKTLFFHWAPDAASSYLDSRAWRTEAVPVHRGRKSWMFCLPLQVDGVRGIDLVAGGKGPNAGIGWLESPNNPRDVTAWKWHDLRDAGWVMSINPVDMDRDGDVDLLVSDRKGKSRACLWLENPGPVSASGARWKEQRIGEPEDREFMFLEAADLDRDGLLDVVVALRDRELIYYRRSSRKPARWATHPIRLPANTGTGKGVAIGDIDLDGRPDIVLSCENARGLSGVIWLSPIDKVTDPIWKAHEVSGVEGIKYDLVKLLDLDDDGDLDILTCEEGRNLGVIWYENPRR